MRSKALTRTMRRRVPKSSSPSARTTCARLDGCSAGLLDGRHDRHRRVVGFNLAFGVAEFRNARNIESWAYILTKADPGESNTGYAQGGVAAAVGPDDSPDLHARDTINAGDGLCDPDAVRVLVSGGPRSVNELLAWGGDFRPRRQRQPGARTRGRAQRPPGAARAGRDRT